MRVRFAEAFQAGDAHCHHLRRGYRLRQGRHLGGGGQGDHNPGVGGQRRQPSGCPRVSKVRPAAAAICSRAGGQALHQGRLGPAGASKITGRTAGSAVRGGGGVSRERLAGVTVAPSMTGPVVCWGRALAGGTTGAGTLQAVRVTISSSTIIVRRDTINSPYNGFLRVWPNFGVCRRVLAPANSQTRLNRTVRPYLITEFLV